jgi:GNAT superfamily N-acetyltransferase
MSDNSLTALSQPLPITPFADLRVVEFGDADEATLQRFFVRNPAYFEIVEGRAASATAAIETINARIPDGWPYTRRWCIGFCNAAGGIEAVADVVSDLLAARVWHIGLFMVDASRLGNGDAQAIYAALEDWARVNGAEWLRLGVVVGNVRAERFWARQGYVQTSVREGVVMGLRTNALRVMAKPLCGGCLEQLYELVPRARPDFVDAT